jgi:SAM-dependent methyltransferase
VNQFECALCRSKKNKQVFSAFDFDHSVEPFEIRQCLTCGLAQTFPIPDPTSLNNYYPKSYYGSGGKKFPGVIEFLTVFACRFRAKRILKALSGSAFNDGKFKVLDIGCGRANILRQLDQMGCECYGTERETYPSDSSMPDITIHRGALEDGNFEDASFDAVIIWHVLEHLYDPGRTLDEVARITREGGLAAIAVPNFSSLQSRWFKSNWFHLDLPRHLYHFDADNLSHVLTQRGYIVHSVSTCSLEQNLFGFIQSLMNCFKLLGKPNEFYQLLKQRSGFNRTLKLAFWITIALLIFPFALLEFAISCVLKKGASVIIFARKPGQKNNKGVE